ncbi:MAG: hypothetical protein HYY08_02730 [Firmicutes bacterium]|nr:hypothetical protein [Bacillota bacterium]
MGNLRSPKGSTSWGLVLFLTLVLAMLAQTAGAAAVPAAPAAFSGVGAKAYAMGGAFVAIADDLSGIYWNPAGLAATNFEINVSLGGFDLAHFNTFSQLATDPGSWTGSTSLEMVGLAGVGVSGFALGALVDGGANISVPSPGEADVSGTYGNELILAGGKKIDIKGFPGDVSVGASARKVSRQAFDLEASVDQGEGTRTTVTESYRGTGYLLDVGMMYSAGGVRLGIVGKNLLGTLDWSGDTTTEVQSLLDPDDVTTSSISSSWTEQPAQLFSAGLSVRSQTLGLLLAASVTSTGEVRYGLQRDMLGSLVSLRLGQIQPLGAPAVTTAGVGINFMGLHTDVAAARSSAFKGYKLMLTGGISF